MKNMQSVKIAGLAAALFLAAGLVAVVRGADREQQNDSSTNQPARMKDLKKPGSGAVAKTIVPEQFTVTQQCGTEPPFRNAYWDNHQPGLYVDVVSGEPLFSSLDKFDSGTGWPSFTRPVAGTGVVEKQDTAHGMARTEVRSKQADSHLGHVFDDGPGPTGLRYCINLRFAAVHSGGENGAEGYGAYLEPFVKAGLIKASAVSAASDKTSAATQRELAILAGGCFWGLEEILRKIPGVLETTVGYSGGTVAHPTYQQVCTGRTGHAEAIQWRSIRPS